jgi:integrase
MEAATRIYFDTRHKKKSKKYPLKLRVHFNGKTKFYPLGIELTKSDEKGYRGSQPNQEQEKIKNKVEDKLKNARAVIRKLKPFSWEEFEVLMEFRRQTDAREPETGNSNDVFYRYRKHIGKLKSEGMDPGSYELTYKALVKFLNARRRRTGENTLPHLYFTEIDVAFLNEFEDWFLNKNFRKLKDGSKIEYSVTTYAIYVSTLRTLMGIAREEGLITPLAYPFGKNKYKIPKRRTNHRALEQDDLIKLMQFSFNDPVKDKYLDLWRFSFLTGGMNVTDICRLKNKDITDGGTRITYKRQKNSRHKDQPEIKVFLPPRAVQIMERYRSALQTPSQYVFPFLDTSTPPDRVVPIIKQLTRQINKYSKRAAEELGINLPPTTIVARHSAATKLLRSEKSVEVISSILGHTDIKTTQIYLKGFTDSQLKDASGALDM